MVVVVVVQAVEVRGPGRGQRVGVLEELLDAEAGLAGGLHGALVGRDGALGPPPGAAPSGLLRHFVWLLLLLLLLLVVVVGVVHGGLAGPLEQANSPSRRVAAVGETKEEEGGPSASPG